MVKIYNIKRIYRRKKKHNERKSEIGRLSGAGSALTIYNAIIQFACEKKAREKYEENAKMLNTLAAACRRSMLHYHAEWHSTQTYQNAKWFVLNLNLIWRR